MPSDTLPPTFHVRRPSMEDLESVFELMTASDIAEFGEPDYSLQELREEWEELDLSKDAWVIAEPGGKLVGYGLVFDRAHVQVTSEGYVHPDYWGQGIGTRLVQLIESRAEEHVPLAPEGARVTLDNYINSYNEAAGSLLREQGYTLSRRHWRMVIELTEPPATAEAPEGITIRTFVPERDERAVYEAVTEAFGDMWGYLPPSFEQWKRQMIEREGFDSGLWWLAMDGEQIAGFALCTYRQEMGWVRSLGVRRPWRQRGLGLTLLRVAFAEFYARGRRKVGLGVDSQSLTGATRLYERAGMRVDRQFDQYRKELRGGEVLAVQEVD